LFNVSACTQFLLQLHGTSDIAGETQRFALLLSSGETQTVADPQEAAEAADLRYVSDERAGIRRQKSGKGFVYLHPDGTKVFEPRLLGHIRSLAVPPAWTDVWICPFADGHIQATGPSSRRPRLHR
jgi:DNA topoisomerase-1